MIDLKKFFGFANLKNTSFRSLGKKENAPPLYAPGTQITYDADLVPKLKKDHVQLVNVYTDILDAISHREYEKLASLLEIFLALFNAHVLVEYTKLYIFLDYSFRSNQVNHDLIMRFRREMNDIGKTARSFAHYWRKNGVDDSSVDEFQNQVQKIGEVLTKRIEVEEEQLYEIYNSAPNQLTQSSLTSH